MDTFISHLEKRITATQGELEEAQKASLDAKCLVESLIADLDGYSKVLEAEQRRSGVTKRKIAPEAQPVAGGSSEEPTAALNGSDVNKSAFIRDFIANNPGAKPVEIHRALAVVTAGSPAGPQP